MTRHLRRPVRTLQLRFIESIRIGRFNAIALPDNPDIDDAPLDGIIVSTTA